MATDFVAKGKEIQERLSKFLLSYIDGDNEYGTPVQPYLRQILIDARDSGYKLWEDGDSSLSNPLNLQKCFRNEKGHRLYFIDIRLWDLAREFPQHEKRWGITLSPSVQFYRGVRHSPSERPVNVSVFTVEGEKLSDIEKFFSDFYERMECVPYEAD